MKPNYPWLLLAFCWHYSWDPTQNSETKHILMEYLG
jgi:hypothetical protein